MPAYLGIQEEQSLMRYLGSWPDDDVRRAALSCRRVAFASM